MLSESAINIFWNSPIGPFLREITIIGQGGFGTVYKAYHTALNRTVAVKVLNQTAFEDEIAVARFMREARALEQIEHPNVVRVYSCGSTSAGLPYMVMEFLVGRTITAELEETGGRFPVPRARDILAQILKGVGAMHANGIIHRDLTPANCIVVQKDDTQESVKIFDFGLVKSSSDSENTQQLTRTAQVCGTAAYIAPEVWLQQRPNELTDIYSLGCLLYQMVTGQPPFVETLFAQCNLQHVSSAVTPAYITNTDNVVYPALEAVLQTSLSKNAEDRYQSVEEFGRALQKNLDTCIPVEKYHRTRLGCTIFEFARIAGLITVGAALIFLVWSINKAETISDRMETLKIQDSELTKNLSASESNLASTAKGNAALRKKLCRVKLELAGLMAGEFKADRGPHYRKEAVNGYFSALSLCHCWEDSMETLVELRQLVPFAPRHYGFDYMAEQFDTQSGLAFSESRYDDALVLARAFLLTDPKTMPQSASKMLQIATIYSERPKYSHQADLYRLRAERLLTNNYRHTNSLEYAKDLMVLAHLAPKNESDKVRKYIATAEKVALLPSNAGLPAKADLLCCVAENTLVKLDDLKKAQDLARLGVKAFESLDKGSFGHGHCLDVLSVTQSRLGSFREAIVNEDKAGEIFIAGKFYLQGRIMYARLAEHLLGLGDKALMQQYEPKLTMMIAVPFLDNPEDRFFGMLLRLQTVIIMFALGQDEMATRYFDATPSFHLSSKQVSFALDLIGIASSFSKTKHFRQARWCLDEAERLMPEDYFDGQVHLAHQSAICGNRNCYRRALLRFCSQLKNSTERKKLTNERYLRLIQLMKAALTLKSLNLDKSDVAFLAGLEADYSAWAKR